MNITEAGQVIRLLQHLDRSDPREVDDLIADAQALADRAGSALQMTFTVDDGQLAQFLGLVDGGWAGCIDFGDYGDDSDGYVITRPIVDVPVAGGRL